MCYPVFFLLDHAPGCYGQHLQHGFEGIVRVETPTGTGTGFIVATEGDRTEVWTNAHVSGPEDSRVRCRIWTGTENETVFNGTVVFARLGDGIDIAKIIGDFSYDGRVHRIGNGDSLRRLAYTAGHPHGGRAYALAVADYPDANIGRIRGYKPPSIRGQSGSPVTDSEGFVIGVVTYKLGVGRNATGGILPIDDWRTNGQRVSTSNVTGDFAPLGLGPPVVND
jgi:S1-C subfamily serine protease